MGIFSVHRQIVGDYASYIRSFVTIADDELRRRVEQHLDDGHLWPEPLLAFNPSFSTAGQVETLAKAGVFTPQVADAFRGFELFEHQLAGIRLGIAGTDFVVTSGTGSGKSLIYIGAIFEHLFRQGLPMPPGVTAVVVYPLNALVNSQEEELGRYAENYRQARGETFPIRFAKFTGQEDIARRQELEAEPPHILLTNYMMLELLLTRGSQAKLRAAVYDHLRFLVFDELHTYRGRQGADVGLLIRRIRGKAKLPVVCIGTSATMVSAGTLAEQKQQVAKVAEQLFGKPFSADAIVQETLAPRFAGPPPTSALRAALAGGVGSNASEADLLAHPTAAWLESSIALREQEGRLVRNIPRTFSSVVAEIASTTGALEEECASHLRNVLLWASRVNASLPPERRRYAYLPFKLYQFFSQTGAVYLTLDRDGERHITLRTGYHVPGQPDRPLFPAVFSRLSGETFLCVSIDASRHRLLPRAFYPSEDEDDDATRGYLIPNPDVWNPETDTELLPDSWLEAGPGGLTRVQKEYRGRIPQRLFYDRHGDCSDEPRDGWMQGWFMTAPLLFDPTSGLMPDRQTKDSTKLSQLGTEGRSTATSISAFAILTRIAESGYSLRDQKLLSFMDNRQDAALQAGHFNDFMDVVRLRSAIRKAVETAENKTLRLTTLGRAIRTATGLRFEDYANRASVDMPEFRKRPYEEALENYLALRAIHDLRRGWRVILPNLEQCALLQVDYEHLDEIAAAEGIWRDVPLLHELAHGDRRELLRVTLDLFRHEFALFDESLLSEARIKEHATAFRERLQAPWRYEDEDEIPSPTAIRTKALTRYSRRETRSIGSQSGFGKFARRFAQEKLRRELSAKDYVEFVERFLATLEGKAGYLVSAEARSRDGTPTRLYQLRLTEIIWQPGDGKSVRADSVKLRAYKSLSLRPNAFFQGVYRRDYSAGKLLLAADHTGQLGYKDKQDREERFRATDSRLGQPSFLRQTQGLCNR